MQSEQRARLVALATRVAAERDPVRFHALVLELNQLLERDKQSAPVEGEDQLPVRQGK